MTPQAGAGGLTQQDVTQIVTNAVNTANTTRAVIRLPDGSRARMAIAVADLNGNLLALHRMPDATVFSIDVAVAKSRNVIYFSGTGRTAQDLPGVPSATAVTAPVIVDRSCPCGGLPDGVWSGLVKPDLHLSLGRSRARRPSAS